VAKIVFKGGEKEPPVYLLRDNTIVRVNSLGKLEIVAFKPIPEPYEGSWRSKTPEAEYYVSSDGTIIDGTTVVGYVMKYQ
jgi:hypothetical protein